VKLVRGFKAEAERHAARLWTELGLRPVERFDLVRAAETIGARIVPGDEILARERFEELEAVQAFAFSAATFEVDTGHVIVSNPVHWEGRQRADQAHELAHLILGHRMRTPEQVGQFVFYTGDQAQEDEANWLAGCLLLPRSVLIAAAARGLDAKGIASRYGTTEAMVRFRLNTSGATRQIERARAR
jgi:Zn-dependent peptidase ImmA (M78 family)